MFFLTDEQTFSQYDSHFIQALVLWILAIPLLAISQIYTFLNIEVSLYGVIPICLLLDLLILPLRTGSLKNFLKKTYKKLLSKPPSKPSS